MGSEADSRMTKTPEELLAMRYGGATVAENIKREIESGKVIEDENGFLSFRDTPPNIDWVMVPNGPLLRCTFLIGFMFEVAYAKSAVPNGCSACYKVKVAPRTLRELVAAWGIGKRIECLSKWGVDLNNAYSQDVYAGYFYTSGLDQARAIYRIAREAIDGEPKLGPDIPMSIKRGCSDYEAALGPSDKYEFPPELAELEAYLKTKFIRRRKSENARPLPLAHWIDTAFRIGDDTYLDFTGGRPLRPKTLTYDPA